MNNNILIVFVLLIVLATNFSFDEVRDPVQNDWHLLFDGTDLDQWDTYLGPRWDPDKGKFDGEPVGLNHDPDGVFSIVEQEGENLLRISGEVWGGISTKESFRNYHLRLTFKWGEKRWPPRENTKRDNGLLYHGVGEHGAGSGFWLRSQEFQIQEGDVGDYWAVAGAIVDIPSELVNDSIYRYKENGQVHTFGRPPANTVLGIYCKKNPDAENTSGEWNTVDLYVYEGNSVHVVNGIVTMKLENSRQIISGQRKPLTEGRIQIQSESAEIFYKDIRIRPIEQMPEGL